MLVCFYSFSSFFFYWRLEGKCFINAYVCVKDGNRLIPAEDGSEQLVTRPGSFARPDSVAGVSE